MISLNDKWLSVHDPHRSGIVEGWFHDPPDWSRWHSVKLRRFWEGYPGLADPEGWTWFARTFEPGNLSVPYSMHLAGVDDAMQMWVNGIEVGQCSRHPFVLDVTRALRSGANSVVLVVKDSSGGGKIYTPITLIPSQDVDSVVVGRYAALAARQSEEWVKDAVMYCVYLRSFSTEGTFSGLEKRIPHLKELGVTVLWLLPIHPVGAQHRKGGLGSPYAVRDYYAVNPEFGSMTDFRSLLATAHRHGLKLILDLVANHTSWDSVLIKEHPEWFTRDRHGSIVSPNSDWTDVADLDYSQPGVRRYMIDMMCWWLRDIGIDGFRCDVAELVPTDFWEAARKEMDVLKPVLMLSEGSLPEHHRTAFDLTYSWNVYNALPVLLAGKRPTSLIDQLQALEEHHFPGGSLRMRFVTNHDKNAWDAPACIKFGADGVKLAVVLVTTLPGVPMIYTGEEVANDRRLSLFEKVEVDWNRPRDMERLYATLFRLRRAHTALSRGRLVRVPSSNDRETYAFLRVKGEDRILVVLNFADAGRDVVLRIPPEFVPGVGRGLRLTDVFDGSGRDIEGGEIPRVAFRLGAKGYGVYVVE